MDFKIHNGGINSTDWQHGVPQLKGPGREALLHNGRGPKPGDLLRNRDLAKTMRALSESGSDAFYKGDIAQKVRTYACMYVCMYVCINNACAF